MFGISLFVLVFYVRNSSGKISQEDQEIIRKWMPTYWLHSEEVFFPTNFEYYISQMELRDADQNIVDINPTAETLIIGPESVDLHLNTKSEIDCVHCYDDAFFGLPLDQLHPYAIAKVWNDSCNTIDVKFNTWYPYNYGKDVCFSIDPNGFCLGVRVTIGNHFCDGDHSLMRIQNGEPKYLQLNAHSIGALYEYNKETRNYDFLSGESLDVLGIDFNVEYPEIVSSSIEGHPEIFIANGSHGNWGQPGKHNYLTLVIHLDDYTDRGLEWKYYEQAEIIDYFDTESEDIEALPPNLQFRKFQGHFGNTEGIGCNILDPIIGECQVGGCGGQPFGGNPTYKKFEDPPICDF